MLLSVVYDYHRKTVIRMDAYQNLIQCLAEGSVYHAEVNICFGVEIDRKHPFKAASP